MPDNRSTNLMKAVMRDLNARDLGSGWKVSVSIKPPIGNVWLYLTEPCYCVSAGRWFYTAMHEDARLPDYMIHQTVDDLITQLNDQDYLRRKAREDFRRFLLYRECHPTPPTSDDDALAKRARDVLAKRRGSEWGDW